MKTSITVTLTPDDVNSAIHLHGGTNLRCQLVRRQEDSTQESRTKCFFQVEIEEAVVRQACMNYARTAVKIEPGAVLTCKLDYDNAGHVSATVTIDRGALINGK